MTLETFMHITVHHTGPQIHDGAISWKSNGEIVTKKCALGRSGIRQDKREGDGATPVGIFPLRKLCYRADRFQKPPTALPTQAIQETDGWCDDPDHPLYNKPVRLPFAGSHEDMWREDYVYDLVLVIGHNDDPPVPGKGSCIFVHIINGDYEPTAGCIALSEDDMVELLEACSTDSILEIKN
jgi:L,D-peptidoglycan transpeptidase YkuD (ErfK/YbiS/YcfS/YnhG family)